MSENDTEHSIKEAARKLFQEKGFAATKTRDIAEAAGINLALLNYYFRSKQKLFDIIMLETIHGFFHGLVPMMNDEQTTLREKIDRFVASYIDLLSEHPDVVTFIINEVRVHPEKFMAKMGFLDQLQNAAFIRQFQAAVLKGEIPPINPLHFMMNLAGLVVFPFIATPMIAAVTGIAKDDLIDVIQERKRLIPLWIESMLTVK